MSPARARTQTARSGVERTNHTGNKSKKFHRRSVHFSERIHRIKMTPYTVLKNVFHYTARERRRAEHPRLQQLETSHLSTSWQALCRKSSELNASDTLLLNSCKETKQSNINWLIIRDIVREKWECRLKSCSIYFLQNGQGIPVSMNMTDLVSVIPK